MLLHIEELVVANSEEDVFEEVFKLLVAKLWDELLSYKLRHVEGLKALSRLMSHHGRGSKPCPCCEENSMTVSV